MLSWLWLIAAYLQLNTSLIFVAKIFIIVCLIITKIVYCCTHCWPRGHLRIAMLDITGVPSKLGILFSLSHQGSARKPEAYGVGSHYLHSINLHLIKWPECRKESQPSGDLNPSNVQSRHVPQEPQTNWDGISFCVLLYLIISDFSK